jgi:hypothetical protein
MKQCKWPIAARWRLITAPVVPAAAVADCATLEIGLARRVHGFAGDVRMLNGI